MTRRFLFPGGGLALDRGTIIMGVVNVTPDSFSDGGLWQDPEAAIAQGLRLAAEGASILDIGGESTRPGSQGVSARVEMERVLPVIEALKSRCDAVLSIDTSKAEVAQAACKAGAAIINDVTALGGDPDMAGLAAATKAGLVLMHMRGAPRTMQDDPHYDDVVAEVKAFLLERAEKAMAAGVERGRIVLDPGIGFGKTMAHNLTLIKNLGALKQLGFPVLLGASNKRFIGTLTGRDDAGQRLWGTMGAHVAGAMLGADMVRVHEVAPLREALAVSDAILRG
jgi:dihydropteroate synthase